MIRQIRRENKIFLHLPSQQMELRAVASEFERETMQSSSSSAIQITASCSGRVAPEHDPPETFKTQISALPDAPIDVEIPHGVVRVAVCMLIAPFRGAFSNPVCSIRLGVSLKRGLLVASSK